MKKLISRLFFVPVTFLFLFWIVQTFDKLVFGLFVKSFGDFDKAHYYYQFPGYFFLSVLLFWFVAQIVFEFHVLFRPGLASSRLAKHLRYAPIATVIFSIFVVLAYDQAMIQYSKWRISSYIFANSTRIEKPDFSPHVNYRGWCGNGYTAAESGLYFDVASSGLDDADPYVRSRSLLMVHHVRDFFNGSDTEKMLNLTRKACLDEKEIVKNNVEVHLQSWGSNCAKILEP